MSTYAEIEKEPGPVRRHLRARGSLYQHSSRLLLRLLVLTIGRRSLPYLQPGGVRTTELFAKWLVDLVIQPFIYGLLSRWSVYIWLEFRDRNRVVICEGAVSDSG